MRYASTLYSHFADNIKTKLLSSRRTDFFASQIRGDSGPFHAHNNVTRVIGTLNRHTSRSVRQWSITSDVAGCIIG